MSTLPEGLLHSSLLMHPTSPCPDKTLLLSIKNLCSSLLGLEHINGAHQSPAHTIPTCSSPIYPIVYPHLPISTTQVFFNSSSPPHLIGHLFPSIRSLNSLNLLPALPPHCLSLVHIFLWGDLGSRLHPTHPPTASDLCKALILPS